MELSEFSAFYNIRTDRFLIPILVASPPDMINGCLSLDLVPMLRDEAESPANDGLSCAGMTNTTTDWRTY